MTLNETEQRFLSDHRQGRLATIGPGGPQVKPVGFSYDADLGTIDISGFNMAESAKFRNVRSNPKVAFVVDDILFDAMEGVRFLEVRGEAEAVSGPPPADPHLAP
jgi:pyridoxamine 5'-phosphate oxidase family protein